MRRLLAVTFLACGLGLAGTGTVAAQTELTFSLWIPWTHPVARYIMIPWMENVEKETEGRVTFRHLPKPVASPPAHFDAVRTGQADVAFGNYGYNPKRFAPYLFAELPFIGDSAVDSSVAFWRVQDRFLADAGFHPGVHLLGVMTHGPGQLHLSGAAAMSPADVAGKKIRVGGAIPQKITEAWGGVPIRQPAPKSYELLSTGIIDGIMFPYESLPSFNITSLVPYTTDFPGGLYNSAFYLIMNEDKWNALSEEDREAIDRVSGEAFARLAGAGWDRTDREGLEAMQEAGNTIVEAPPEFVAELEKLNRQFEQEYVQAATEAGVDGAAILQAFRAELEKIATEPRQDGGN